MFLYLTVPINLSPWISQGYRPVVFGLHSSAYPGSHFWIGQLCQGLVSAWLLIGQLVQDLADSVTYQSVFMEEICFYFLASLPVLKRRRIKGHMDMFQHMNGQKLQHAWTEKAEQWASKMNA